MYITLKEIEKEYAEKFHNTLNNGNELTADLFLKLSITLFNELKVKGISDSEAKENDMLLFQYGTYEWDSELGKHFYLDITRQFMKSEEDEPYQLSFTLIYEPEQFKTTGSYYCWSDEFSDINDFAASIKETEGFKEAAKYAPLTYRVYFEQL